MTGYVFLIAIQMSFILNFLKVLGHSSVGTCLSESSLRVRAKTRGTELKEGLNQLTTAHAFHIHAFEGNLNHPPYVFPWT